MKKSIVVLGVVVLFALGAAAQDIPKMETFLGYTYVRVNSATNISAFSANGGSGQFVYNFNKYLGGVMDLGAVHNGDLGGLSIDNTAVNFLLGPRLSFRYSRLTPYFEALFGGSYIAASSRVSGIGSTPVIVLPVPQTGGFVPIIPDQPITSRLVTSQTAFAMAIGGGLDIKLNKNVSFRPVGLDYYMTRFQNLRSGNDNNQNNLRFTTGVNFTFGAQ
jgi:opacity protein-like surface antigen